MMGRITFMKQKSSDVSKPKDFGPITCLPTTNIIFTALLIKKDTGSCDQKDIRN